MAWLSFLFPQQPPAAPPPRQLMAARLMNMVINPFARATLDGLGNFQRGVYFWDDGRLALPYTEGFPQWPMIEFFPLGPLKTGRSRILLPENFTLLSYWASSSVNVNGGFRVNVYDVNRRVALTMYPSNFNTIAGQGSAPLFMSGYSFGRSVKIQGVTSPPQAKINIVNLETSNNNIQFGFYGLLNAKCACS